MQIESKRVALIAIRLLIAGHIFSRKFCKYLRFHNAAGRQERARARERAYKVTIIEMFSLKPSIKKDHSLLLLISVRETLKVFYDIYGNIYIISVIMISTQNV